MQEEMSVEKMDVVVALAAALEAKCIELDIPFFVQVELSETEGLGCSHLPDSATLRLWMLHLMTQCEFNFDLFALSLLENFKAAGIDYSTSLTLHLIEKAAASAKLAANTSKILNPRTGAGFRKVS